MSKRQGSSSGWEDSYFGGYQKVLYDYPEIKEPYDIDVNLPKDRGDLGYYTGHKLTSLLQMKIAEYGLIESFLNNAEIVEQESFFTKKKYLKANPKAIKGVIKQVISADNELASMFTHYEDILQETEFLYKIPDKKRGKGEEGEGGDGKRMCSLNEAIQNAHSLIMEIKKRKEWTGNGDSISGELKLASKFSLMKADKQIIYTKEEILQAGRLVDLLDISFDPVRDKLANLRTGKLDINKIASVPAGNHHIHYRIEENQTTKPFSICILADESGSMRGGPDRAQQSILKILYNAFSQIVPTNKIFIYGHSGWTTPDIRIYNDNYNQIFEKCIDNQEGNAWCQNYDGPVIEAIYERVRAATDDNILFLAISDGQPAGESYGGALAIKDMKRVIEKCKRDGFVTMGVGISYGMVKEIYSYHTVVTNLSKMAKQVATLVNQVVKSEFQSND